MMKVLKRQLKILIESKKNILFFYAFLYALSAGLLPIAGVIMPKYIFDSLSNDNFNETIVMIVIFVLVSLVLAVLSIFVKGKADNLFVEVRLKEFDKLNHKILKIDYAYLESDTFNTDLSTFSRTLNNNDDGFEGAYRKMFEMVPLIVTVILSAVLLGVFNLLVIVGCIVGTTLGGIATWAYTKYEFKKRGEYSDAIRKVSYFNGVASDFSYGKDIRVYNFQDQIISNLDRRITTYIDVVKNLQKTRFKTALLGLFGLLIQDSLAYFFVVIGYLNGVIDSLSSVTLYILAIIALGTSLRTLFNTTVLMRKDTKYTEDYFKFIDSSNYYTQKGSRKKLDEPFDIEFKNITFKYPKTDKYIFKNFSFKIARGEKLAVVGLNGCGKTTFIKLLCGLIFPESGEILVNGVNIIEFSGEEYHKMFSLVFQDTHLYAATVLENVIGNDTDDEAIERGKKAIEMVGLKEKIESLPKQYENHLLKIIDPEGIDLSGGQIQKLAIARALYKNGNFIVLDEPTAALDALAEADIYESFNALIGEKTAVYISHRLTSTKFCDKIAFFEDGQVKEYGSHNELMDKKASYYELFVTQGKYYQEEKKDDII